MEPSDAATREASQPRLVAVDLVEVMTGQLRPQAIYRMTVDNHDVIVKFYRGYIIYCSSDHTIISDSDLAKKIDGKLGLRLDSLRLSDGTMARLPITLYSDRNQQQCDIDLHIARHHAHGLDVSIFDPIPLNDASQVDDFGTWGAALAANQASEVGTGPAAVAPAQANAAGTAPPANSSVFLPPYDDGTDSRGNGLLDMNEMLPAYLPIHLIVTEAMVNKQASFDVYALKHIPAGTRVLVQPCGHLITPTAAVGMLERAYRERCGRSWVVIKCALCRVPWDAHDQAEELACNPSRGWTMEFWAHILMDGEDEPAEIDFGSMNPRLLEKIRALEASTWTPVHTYTRRLPPIEDQGLFQRRVSPGRIYRLDWTGHLPIPRSAMATYDPRPLYPGGLRDMAGSPIPGPRISLPLVSGAVRLSVPVTQSTPLPALLGGSAVDNQDEFVDQARAYLRPERMQLHATPFRVDELWDDWSYDGVAWEADFWGPDQVGASGEELVREWQLQSNWTVDDLPVHDPPVEASVVPASDSEFHGWNWTRLIPPGAENMDLPDGIITGYFVPSHGRVGFYVTERGQLIPAGEAPWNPFTVSPSERTWILNEHNWRGWDESAYDDDREDPADYTDPWNASDGQYMHAPVYNDNIRGGRLPALDEVSSVRPGPSHEEGPGGQSETPSVGNEDDRVPLTNDDPWLIPFTGQYADPPDEEDLISFTTDCDSLSGSESEDSIGEAHEAPCQLSGCDCDENAPYDPYEEAYTDELIESAISDYPAHVWD